MLELANYRNIQYTRERVVEKSRYEVRVSEFCIAAVKQPHKLTFKVLENIVGADISESGSVVRRNDRCSMCLIIS